MQGLWSRTALSSQSCRCVSCLRTGANVVAERSTAAASRQRLRIGNSVTILYSSIFATAIMYDLETKAQRRNQLEQKIAAVKEEVKELQDEEVRILEGMATRRKVRQLALPMQRRQYSTASAPNQFAQVERFLHFSQAPMEATQDNTPTVPTPHGDRPEMIADILDVGLTETTDTITEEERYWRQFDLGGRDVLREKAIQRLALRQLAVKLLLRPSIAHTYGGVAPTDGDGSERPGFQAQDLLKELDSIRKRLTRLKYHRDEEFDDLAKNISIQEQAALRQERQELHNNLKEAFELYNSHQIQLRELLLIISKNLLASEEPILPTTAELMITQFTRYRQNDIVNMIIDSLFRHRLLMTPPVIVSAINFYSKTRDLFGFDGLLRLLQGHSSPINMPILWQPVRVGDLEVAVPPKPRHPYMMNALISAALSFNQPHRADAWLHIARQGGYNESAAVLGSYMRFYSGTPNWRKGGDILLRAVSYIMSTKAHLEPVVERLILYMVILCNCCGKHQLSKAIIRAAVNSGLDWKRGTNTRDLRISVRKAIEQWRTAAEEALPSAYADQPIGMRCYEFAKQIEEQIRMAIDYGDHDPERELRMEQERDQLSFYMRYKHQVLGSQSQTSTVPRVTDDLVQHKQPPVSPVPDKENWEAKHNSVFYSLAVSHQTISDLQAAVSVLSTKDTATTTKLQEAVA
ncbi:hypothetical protein FQN53_009438 [Emmonsiellopsis sp. PD_33]|nr:hypothetical protein FQN53_009438 [Emmonsiellopsis sp. PD_33]